MVPATVVVGTIVFMAKILPGDIFDCLKLMSDSNVPSPDHAVKTFVSSFHKVVLIQNDMEFQQQIP